MNNPPPKIPRIVIHLPDSWQRLMTVIKHQAREGQFIFIEAPHGAGKTTFAKILKKKLTLISEITVSYQKLHPLSSLPQIYSSIPDTDVLLPVVILDDASEVSAEVLEELISSNIDYYFVILAEPDLVNRVPRLQNSRFNLPLFNKEDCHKLLNKMYQIEDPSLEVQPIDSELVYYESKGFPARVKEIGGGLKGKLERKRFGINSFESVNKSVFSSILLALGVVLFLVYLFWPKDQKVDNEGVLIEQDIDESPLGVNKNEGELILDSTADANVSEPIMETGELELNSEVEEKIETFDTWLQKQDPDSYTIQLFSNSSIEAANHFKADLDLAESFVYKAKVESGITYRVVWGAYPNRARAQLAIGSLPKEILAQKPWLRSFSSINKELND